MDVKIIQENLKFKFRVSAIIINNDKILVNQYGKDSYCLPGGYVEIGETSENAIIRELREETGLKFVDAIYCGVIENFFTNIRGQKTHGIDMYYKVKLSDETTYDDLTMNRIENDKNGEIQHHFKWIFLEDLTKYNLLPIKIKDIIINKETNFHYLIEE